MNNSHAGRRRGGLWAPGRVVDETGRVLPEVRPDKEVAHVADMETDIIPLAVVSERYAVPRSRLADRAWRRRVGLPVVKLGGRIVGVRAADLAACLRREFEPAKTTT